MTSPHAAEPLAPQRGVSRHILFVDDDVRLISHFAEAVGEAGFSTHHVHGPDEALAYLSQSGVMVDVVVWDMMLPPGEAFRDEDTEAGLSTGRFLLPRMRALCPGAQYILFTARGDRSLTDLDIPDHRSHVRYKTDLTVDAMVDLVRELVSA